MRYCRGDTISAKDAVNFDESLCRPAAPKGHSYVPHRTETLGLRCSMPTRSELLRLKAEELRAIAGAFGEAKTRGELLMLAHQYELLADRVVRLKDIEP